MGVVQVRRIFTLALQVLFHLLCLNVEFGNYMLDIGRIVENQQSLAWQIVQHCRLIVEIRSVECYILE